MSEEDLKVETPGATGAEPADEPTTETVEDLAAKVAQLEADNAQLSAALADANSKLQAVQTVPAALAQVESGPRLIGEDWSNRTSAEAKAAGVTHTVLCADGYFVPGV